MKLVLPMQKHKAAQANANMKNAEVDLQRYETLAQQDAIAQQRVDTQRSTYRTS